VGGHLKYISGATGDTNAYNTGRLTLIGGTINPVNSFGSATTVPGLTTPVAAMTYRIHARLFCTQGGAAVAQIVNLAGPAVSAALVTVSSFEVSAAVVLITNGTFSGALGNVGTTPGAITTKFDVDIDGYITFSASGTFTIGVAEGTNGDTWTVNGGYCDLMPVT
jgi:hypothetical protein